MTPIMTDEEITRVAKARIGFRVHAIVYLCVNLFLVGLWFVTMSLAGQPKTAASFWPIWPELGWGLGLLIHGFLTYFGGSAEWQHREEAKLRAKQGRVP